MDYLAGIFVPTGNRRLNELIGFLMCVSALLLFLSLVSYSPLDPSRISPSVLTVPAMLALLPGHLRWMHVIPIEGLLGRVIGDVLIHYLNLVGAYIVCATVLAVALYLS